MRMRIAMEDSRLHEIQGLGISHNPVESLIAPLATILLLRWAEYVDAEQEAVAAFDGNVYRPAVPRRYHWSSWRELRGEALGDFLQHDLVPALKATPNGTPSQFLRRLVPVVERLGRQAPETTEKLLEWSQNFDFGTYDGRRAAEGAFTAVVERASGFAAGLGGEFLTPPPVVELMIELVRPKPGERIYDPCFGSGGLLATAAGRLLESARQMPPTMWPDVHRESLFGVEIHPDAYCIGLARVILAGIDEPGLDLGDAFEHSVTRGQSSEGFDCVVAVPPWGRTRVQPPITTASRGSGAYIETLFLEHVMASLRHGGRAAIVLPEGLLFRGGRDREVRKQLISDFCVEGVISLPAGAFHPYTGIKASLVAFSRRKAATAVRFLQVDEWPTYRVGDESACSKAIAFAHRVAVEFRTGTPNGRLWETPTTKLPARAWELVAKRTGEEALSRSLTALDEADGEVVVMPLTEVADLRPGVSYLRADITGDREHPSILAGLLRVADLGDGDLRRPSRFLMKDRITQVPAEARLRTGDILLSTFGTIGKLGIVSEENGAVGAVAARGVVVVRPRSLLSPQFLECLLASDCYQKWLGGHARGATVQHLPARVLRDLPVPVPELPIQERVARQTVSERGHPLTSIIRILTDSVGDPIVAWIDESAVVRELRRWRRADSPLPLLGRIADSVRNLREDIANSHRSTMPSLDRWMTGLAEAMRTLRDLNDVPAGSGRMAVLDSARLRLEGIRSALGESTLPVVDAANDVTRRISGLAQAESAMLLEDVTLEWSVEPSVLVVGRAHEVQVRVKNLSVLAVRDVSVSTHPDIGSTHLVYLAEGQRLGFSGKIPTCTDTGSFPFRLQWRAERLDGRPASGEVLLAIDVRRNEGTGRLREFGTSPYVVGSPIDREEMFFGRQDTIDEIRRQLRTSDRANVILLEGNRRTGKTSILKQLQAPSVLPDWITVNCSFQSGEGHATRAGLPTNEVFRLMAREVGLAAHAAGLPVSCPNVDLPDAKRPFKVTFVKALREEFSGSRPFEAFELFLQAVMDTAKPRRLLLMLDEFDKVQEGIDAGVTSPQVPENIRYLLHTYPTLSAVLAGSRRIKRLREEYWHALFGFGHRVPVSALSAEDARLLVTQPVAGRLSYVPEASESVVELCAQQPFLIQSLCNRIFEHAARANKRTVTVGDVEAAAEVMAEDNEHFRTLWGYAGTERRRLVLALCQHLEKGPDPITLNLLETRLEEHGVALPRGQHLGDDLGFLRELELLDLRANRRGSEYGLAIPLMAAWIRRNIDFEEQRRRAVEESEEADPGGGYGSGYGHTIEARYGAEEDDE